ncbi:hypothetical protein ACOBQX_15940 [Actinokineospora sp. G85]|uniref:hypothetical protein n=1 Tax=Actinokineospora sp. G85 TaxID=3406626 RepID=UPI003C736F84
MSRYAPDAVASALWSARATAAEKAVWERYLRRARGLPGTLLGRPDPTAGWRPDWQAHLLNALVDAYDRAPTDERATTITRVLRGLRVRTLGRWTLPDHAALAWLGFALLRTGDRLGVDSHAGIDSAITTLRGAWTDHGGGGLWSSPGGPRKDAATNAPAALLLAMAERERADRQRARATAEWLTTTLRDPSAGLLRDGVDLDLDSPPPPPAVGAWPAQDDDMWSYRAFPPQRGDIWDLPRPRRGEDATAGLASGEAQGAYISTCVVLAATDPTGGWLAHAAETVHAAVATFAPTGVLRLRPGVGAGLLARCLAHAAPRLPQPAADVARAVVLTSAEAAWRNRAITPGGPILPADWSQPADPVNGPSAERSFATQVGGWLVLEAAARLERA